MSKIPKWFRGEVYEKGNTVTNRFSGKEYKLTAEELSMYDFIMGTQLFVEMGLGHEQAALKMRRGLDWFKKNNNKAFKALMDK